MACFFEEEVGRFCSVRTTNRYHPYERIWIEVCSKCVREWDEAIREHFLPQEETDEVLPYEEE